MGTDKTLITGEDWDRYDFYPPPWHPYWFDHDIYHEDLCGVCEGYGEVDFGQFHSGSECKECQGTGLQEGPLRDRVLAVRELRSVDLSVISTKTIRKAAKLLRQKD